MRWAGPVICAGLTGTARPLRELLIIRTLSAGAARDLAATLLGSAVDYAIQVPAFAGNKVFRIGRGDLVAFLKLADDSDLKRELAVLQLLGPPGVQVPVIEAADPAGDLAGAPCALLRQVDGGPLCGAAPEFGAVGPILRPTGLGQRRSPGTTVLCAPCSRLLRLKWVHCFGCAAAALGEACS